MILARRPYTKLSDLYIQSSAGRAGLRVGILLYGWVTTRLFAEVIRDILRCNFARVELLILSQSDAAVPVAPRRPDPARLWHALGWKLYCGWDRRRLPAVDDPLAFEDCRELLAGIPTLQVTPSFDSSAQQFPDEAVATVRAQNLDVLLHSGSPGLGGQILHAASHGIWAFQHGDSEYYRGGPPYFWEMVEANPLTGTELLELADQSDASPVLQKALFARHPSISLVHNRIQPCWSSAHMVIQKMWEAHNYGWEIVARRMLPRAAYHAKRAVHNPPRNWEMSRWLLAALPKKIVGKVCQRVRAPRVDHWRIAIRSSRQQAGALPLEMDGFQWVESPKGHYYADPFLFAENGRQHLFFEDWSYDENRGVIAHAELTPDGEMGPVRTVLDTGTHASYPCVFADDNQIYMIPETARSGDVRLFRATRFPEEWREEAELFRGTAVDTTVWKGNGLWWFFTTLRDPRAQGTALYLFWSETLAGQWHHHPCNPISFDVRRARGAGNIFRHQEMLVRPSQDCSGRYGRAFALNRIVHLTREEYKEEVFQIVEPDWASGLLSTHTYNRCGNLAVTDGQSWRPWAAVR